MTEYRIITHENVNKASVTEKIANQFVMNINGKWSTENYFKVGKCRVYTFSEAMNSSHRNGWGNTQFVLWINKGDKLVILE